MKPELRVLLLEDNPYDAQLIEHELERAGFVLDLERVDSEQAFLLALERQPQIILADYTLPSYSAIDALRRLRERDVDIPFIVVTGTLDEERAMACVSEGCTDYLLKDRLTRLGQVVTQALEQTRMRAEVRAQRERIEASERRFRAIIENGGEAHILLDVNGEVLYSSGSTVLGYPHPEVIGRRITDFLVAHEGRHATAALADLLRRGAGATAREEYHAVSRTGEEVWLSVCAVNMVADPNVEAIVLTLSDITEARRTRDALTESERRYRSLFEKTRSIICTHDLDGRIIGVNPAVEGVLGYTPEELIGQSWVQFLSPSDAQDVEAGRDRLLREGHTRGLAKVKHRDGTDRYLAFENFVDDGTRAEPLVTTHAVDVTDLEVARRQLRRHAEQRQAMVTGASHFLRSRDWRGAVQEILKGVRTLTHAKTAFLALVDESCTLAMCEPEPPCGEDRVMELWRRLQTETDEAVVVDDDHVAMALVVDGRRVGLLGACSVAQASVQTELLRGLAQTANLIYGSHLTLQHEKELHLELREAQKMEAVGRLVGGIAHDFNNMMTGIMGFTDLAMLQLDPGHPARAQLEEAKSGAERAVSLTRQLLALGRREVLHVEVVDVNEVVGRVALVLGRTLGEDIGLHLALSSQPPRVMADPGSIEQILMNLAINARDAMPRGGSLTVETALVETHACCGACPPGKPSVRLSIVDTGCGMDETVKRRMFDPFFTTKESGKGTGLGLPTTLGIVQQSRGCLAVESRVGHGTRFDIHLPLTEAPAETSRPVVPRAAAAEPHQTVLVLEDEDMVRRLVRLLLRNAGYEVIEAGSAEEALRLPDTRTAAVDLIIADVVLPTMNGREVAERLRQRWPDVRVIYTSGHNDDVVLTYDVSRQEVPFLQKPYTRARLLEMVRQTLTDAGAEP